MIRKVHNQYFLILIFLLSLISCTSKNPSKLTIACAANTQFALSEIISVFEKENGIKVSLIVASSGKLTAQIKEGAPYDVFISADMKFPEEISRSGLALEEPRIYAFGTLILLSLREDIPPSLEILSNEKINHIAVANSKTAPYGKAAEQVLYYYGKYDEIKGKLVFGESISQANQFLNTGAAEIGFTAKSTFRAFAENEGKAFIEFDIESYDPIEQGVVVIKNSNQNEELASKFYLFLFSQKAQDILIKYGYEIPL